MHSSLDCEPSISGGRAARRARELLSQPTLHAAMLLFALAALLFSRRIAGAIHEPLPPVGLLVAAIALSLFAGVAHWIAKYIATQKPARLFSEITLTFSIFAVAATLSMPNTPAWSLSVFWLILLFEEGWSWANHFFYVVEKSNERTRSREGESPAEPLMREDALPPCPSGKKPRPPQASPSEFPDADLDQPLLPEEVTQQLTRSIAADGTEELAGLLRMSFAAHQRTMSVHLAFCPAFAHTPELSVEQIDGPEARIKAVQVLPYGARLDLKLHAASEMPNAVILQFSAHSESHR